MAAIGHAFAQVNTNQTTTSSTFGDVAGAAIADTEFTDGDQYRIVITAQLSGTATVTSSMQTLHGTTVFDESLQKRHLSATGFRWIYQFATVWTAVTGEGIKLQLCNNDNATSVGANFIAITAINLSHDVTENTDWFWGIRTNVDALSTTPLDGGSITFTPAAGHDWLVQTYSQCDPGAQTTSSISLINRSGEAASSLPTAQLETAIDNFHGYLLSRVFTLGNASNTFKEQSATNSGVLQTRLYSSVFAIDLNKFRNHAFSYTENDAALSATNYATAIGTLGITPDVSGDVWYGGYFGYDCQAAARELEFRIQEANADLPAGQTTANYQFTEGKDATDEQPICIQSVQSFTAALHTIDLDGSADSATSAPAVQQATMWAVTMELPATATAQLPRRFISKWAVQRAASW